MRTPTEIINNLLDRGWTQEAIANEIGTTQATISRIARQQHANPSYLIADALRRLEASLNELGG